MRKQFVKASRSVIASKRYAETWKRGNVDRSNLESYQHVFLSFFSLSWSYRIIAFLFCSHTFTKCTNVEASIIQIWMSSPKVSHVLLLSSPPPNYINLRNDCGVSIFIRFNAARTLRWKRANWECQSPELGTLHRNCCIFFFLFFPHKQDPYEIVTACNM